MAERRWTELTPVDGSEGDWLASEVAGADFGRVAGLVGRRWNAYAVVYHAPSDDFDVHGDADLPLGAVYAALRHNLARHTGSHRFVAALWEGCGYFGGGYRRVGSAGAGGSWLDGAARDVYGEVPGDGDDRAQPGVDPEPGPPGPGWERDPGSFGPQAHAVRRMALPHREHVLFDARLDDLDDLPIEHGSWRPREVPSLFWPEDRAWVAACDVDLWVVMVGASEATIADLLIDDRLRADRVAPDDRTRESWVPVGERH